MVNSAFIFISCWGNSTKLTWNSTMAKFCGRKLQSWQLSWQQSWMPSWVQQAVNEYHWDNPLISSYCNQSSKETLALFHTISPFFQGNSRQILKSQTEVSLTLTYGYCLIKDNYSKLVTKKLVIKQFQKLSSRFLTITFALSNLPTLTWGRLAAKKSMFAGKSFLAQKSRFGYFNIHRRWRAASKEVYPKQVWCKSR